MVVVVTVRVVVCGVVDVGVPLTGASERPSVAGSEASPIGCETSRLARYVTPATSTRPARANAMTATRERPMLNTLDALR